MKILVTGAKGFVGKNLCSQLRNIKDQEGHGDIPSLLLEISHCDTIAQFQRLPIEQIVAHILQASQQGAAMKKLSRITGISYRQINKIVKRNSNNS